MTMMKLLIATVAFALLAGCSSRAMLQMPGAPLAQTGLCGSQNYCLVGTPSNTDDTTPPYEWVCLGINGGADTPCSVPTASLTDEDEFFAGDNDLVTRVKAAGPLRGKLVIFDPTVNDEGLTHASGMRRIAVDIGVPEENLVMTDVSSDFFILDEWGDTLDQTLVIGHPTTYSLQLDDRDHFFLKEHDILHVGAAGNANQVIEGSSPGRDLWYPDHPWWESYSWENSLEGFATGKLIIATFAAVDVRGNISPHLESVRCGLAMEYCYSVRKHSGWGGTSSAASALSALSFYLSQLWGTPQEVVGVLNVCAEDIGEPGIDEEYGRGIVSVVCDPVRNREVGVVTRSLRVSSVSPVFDEMTRNAASSAPFRPFFSLNGRNPETMTGHLGGEISVQDTDMFLSAGTGYLPLGIRSSLLPVARTPFMEFGTKRAVFTKENHQLSLLGTYGYSEGDSFSARVGHLGAQYRYELNTGVLSLKVGHRLVRGTVGIPGHREAGAAPVPFVGREPEFRFSFTLR